MCVCVCVYIYIGLPVSCSNGFDVMFVSYVNNAYGVVTMSVLFMFLVCLHFI